MKKTITLEKISKHRMVLMGIAITCVMLCHNTLIVPAPVRKVWNTLTTMMQCGVDMFMLLSGLGLYYSFRKDPDKRRFWSKRFIRILPSYLLSVVLLGIVFVAVLKERTLVNFIWRYSLVSFYLDGTLVVWFIAGIMLLYAAFPLLYLLLQKFPRAFAVGTVACGVLCLALVAVDCPGTLAAINGIFINRLPAFFVGMIIAKAVLDGKKPAIATALVWMVWLVSTLVLGLLILKSKGVWWEMVRLLYLPFCLSGMLLLTKLLDKCRTDKIPYKTFGFLGGLTLEIYLIHQQLGILLDRIWVKISFSHTILAAVANGLAIVLAVLIAWMVHKVADIIIKAATGKKKE